MSDPPPPTERMLNLMERLRVMQMSSPPVDNPLSRPQTILLDWIARHPGCGVLDIAKGLRVTPPTVSVGIHRLLREGWLERRRNPADRRARPLYLTPKGEAYIQTLQDHRASLIACFLSGLAGEEQAQLMELLERAILALETAGQTPD